MGSTSGGERTGPHHEARKVLWRLVLKRGWVTEAEVKAAVGGDTEGRAQLLLALKLAQVEYRSAAQEEAHEGERGG
jgi:hypothetical protein